MIFRVGVVVFLLVALMSRAGEETIDGRPCVVLKSAQARAVFDLAGGAVREFRFTDSTLNPLSWGSPAKNDASVRGYGHFLCLDRWGPASDAEAARGMPYHGEAANVRWTAGRMEASAFDMTARLPKAGLSVKRSVRVSEGSAVFAVREEVTNDNPLGRVFNMVQHPTIAPPFLNEKTVVDCNGRRGFAQGGSLPNPEEPATNWPEARTKEGTTVDLRRLNADPNPNVVSFAIDDKIGWVTAANAEQGLLIGYAWRTADYPWVSVWRDVRDGKPAARGLEFGTTGLHQPFPILVKKGRIWDRPLLEYIDAGQTVSKEYICFLLKVPREFAGIASVQLRGDRLIVRESKGQEFAVALGELASFLQ